MPVKKEATKQRFSQKIKIGKRFVGLNHPTYIIAEIGANFDGDLKKAKKLALTAKELGADCAKFQSFLSEKIVSGKGFRLLQGKGAHTKTWTKSVEQVFKEAEFPREWHKELADYCKGIGIDFSSAPYDFEAVDLLDKLKVPFIKIGSGEINNPEMLKYIAKKERPIILATGDSTLAEVDEAVSIIEASGNKDLILLQCITNYPSHIENANINVIKTYQKAFDVITGYSDHSAGDVVALGAVALGGRVIEKHFTLDKTSKGPDHPHSMDPIEFGLMVKRIRQLESALGSFRKEIVVDEKETVIVQRRSLYAARDIQKGKKIKKEDVTELRPALGILPKYKPMIIGKLAKINIEKGMPIHWDDIA